MANSRVIVAALCSFAIFVFSQSIHADDYPNRTVTIVVPYPAGGPTDETARVVAQSLSKIFNENVITENVTGGGTLIATKRVAKALPDGYTLLLHNLQIAANVTLYKELSFSTEKDLTGVMLINQNPMVLVGRNTLPANTLNELVAALKAGRMRAAITGYGATSHLVTTLLAGNACAARSDSISWRRSGNSRSARRARRSILRDATVGCTAGHRETAEGIWGYGTGEDRAVAERRKPRGYPGAAIQCGLLARAVRPSHNGGGGDQKIEWGVTR
jgi:tripartite-type tricarboxylate transporter receptor subunit TctC